MQLGWVIILKCTSLLYISDAVKVCETTSTEVKEHAEDLSEDNYKSGNNVSVRKSP